MDPTASTTTNSLPTSVEQARANSAIRYTVFINYAAVDQEKAAKLSDQLEKAGYQVWMDRKNLEGSDNWKREIDRALRNSFVMVSVLTPNSVAPDREWVHYEQRQALELFLPIVPLLYEPCELPERLVRINYIDFQHNDDKAVSQLLRAIQKHVLRQGNKLFDEAPSIDRAFIGRRNELLDLHNLIMSDTFEATQTRPALAIHGLAGSGKTMLLSELARRLGRIYPGGVIYEQRGENSLSVQAVLNRWMAQAAGGRMDKDATPQQVRAALAQFGELLIAFDDVWSADFANVELLMDALPPDATRILTTQFRDEAAAIGCQIFPLEHPLEKLNDADALIFIKDRLQSKGPVPEDDVLLRLVHAVDGHPLALEISAGQCQDTGDLNDIIDELVDDLREGVSALRYRNLVKVNTNTSVTMCFDRSLRALEARDEQFATTNVQAFRALGILPDNVSLQRELLGATWDASSSRWLSETLGALTDRALLIRNVQGSQNYHIHPLVCIYARELLHGKPDEYALARERYVRFVTNQASNVYGSPPDQWDADEALVRHVLHIGRTLTNDVRHAGGEARFEALSKSQADESAPSLPDATIDAAFLDLTCDFVESIVPLLHERPELGDVVVGWLDAGLVSARLRNNLKLTALFEKELGIWHSRHSQYPPALAYLAAAVDLARQVGDFHLVGVGLREQGSTAAFANEVPNAIKLHNEALAIQRELGEPEEIADTLMDLGRDYWVLADGKTALKLYDEALQINPHLSPRALNHIGSAHFIMSNYDAAIQYFSQGVENAKRTGSLRWEAENSNDLGAAYRGKGEFQQALVNLKHAIELYAKVGDRRVESIAYNNCAGCYRHLGQYDESIANANKALSIQREIQTSKEIIWTYHELALTYQARQMYSESRRCFEDALQLMQDAHIDDKRTEAGLKGNYGWLLFVGFGERERAEALTEESLRLLIDNGLPRGHTNVTVEEYQERLDKIRGKSEKPAQQPEKPPQRRGFWFWRRRA